MTIILMDNPVATTSSGLFPLSFSMRLDAQYTVPEGLRQEIRDIFPLHVCHEQAERESGGKGDSNGE